MATSSPTEFQLNNSPRNPQSLGQFIRMKRVPQRGKKSNLGIKRLVRKFENKLTATDRVQGSVLASPSAPPHQEDDSDCESWGSDFDDNENVAEDISSWEPQEEMENSINDMLEAAMERDRKLQNSTFGEKKSADGQLSGSNAQLEPEQVAFSSEPNAPPLPPRNPDKMSNASPVNRTRTSAANSTPSRCISKTKVDPSPRSTCNTPAVAQKKSPTQVITSPLSRFAATSTSSTSTVDQQLELLRRQLLQNLLDQRTPEDPARSEISRETASQHQTFPPDVTNISNSSPALSRLLTSSPVISTDGIQVGLQLGQNVARATCEGPPTLESPRQTMSQQAISVFPPDVTNTSNNAPFSRLPSSSPVITVVTGASPIPKTEANRSSNRDASNPFNDSQVGNPPKVKLPQPELAGASNQSNGQSNETSVPPPLPSRPPPLRRPLNNLPIKHRPTHPDAKASASKARNEVAADKEINQKVIEAKNPHPVSSLSNPVIKLQTAKDKSSSLSNLEEHSSQNSPSSESSASIPSTGDHIPLHSVVRLPMKPDPKRKSIALGVPKILKELDAAVLKQVALKKRSKSASVGEVERSLGETRRPSVENSAKAEDANSPSGEYLNPKEMSTQAINENPETGLEFPLANDEVFRQPWYHPVTWTQAQFKLTTMAQDGAFLVRPSSKISEGVPFTISVFFRGRVINCHITGTPEKKYVLGKLKPNQKTFATVTELIRYYQSTPAELKINETAPVSKVCLLITPPRDTDKIYADA